MLRTKVGSVLQMSMLFSGMLPLFMPILWLAWVCETVVIAIALQQQPLGGSNARALLQQIAFTGTMTNQRAPKYCQLSGPISRDTAILSLRYPISRNTSQGRSALSQNGAIPPLALSFTRHVCAIPHFATYRAIIARYPTKQAQKSFAILSLQVQHDMKSIAAGPLRLSTLRTFTTL